MSETRRRPLAQPSELRRCEGQEAIYTENGIASRVRLDRVICDGWGVTAELTTVSSPGLVTGHATGLVGPEYTVGCCWALFWTGRLGWHSSGQGCTWGLYFDPQLVQEIIRLGASLHGKVDRGERLRTLRGRLNEAFIEDCR